MPTICMFRGIIIYLNYLEHQPPHSHAEYGEYECSITINDIEMLSGQMPNKQLKMIFGWAALHQDELHEEWYLAQTHKELFPIEPLK